MDGCAENLAARQMVGSWRLQAKQVIGIKRIDFN
jgi:hypothetical protein